jgi:uncharacterized phage protein gp47/JayE
MIQTPTASELSTQVLADIEGALGQQSPLLPKAFLRVLSRAIGGALALMYRLIRWTYEQIFPATADAESLIRIGQQYGLSVTPSVAAILDIQLVGTPGAEAPAGTIWRGGNGKTYIQNGLSVIGISGISTAHVECTEGGSLGSLGVGNTLEAATPAAGIDGASVLEILTEGEDEETTEQFRSRVLQRIAGQPQGGSAADYVKWATEIPGIVKAFAFRTDAGEVTVYPLQATEGADRIPAAGKLAEVLSYVSNPSRRPLCADVLVEAMTERTVDITITTLSPSDATTKAAIISELQRYLYAAYPRQYPDEENPTHVISVAAIWSIILFSGAAAASVTMDVSGTGAVTRYELANSDLCKLGTVTWA